MVAKIDRKIIARGSLNETFAHPPNQSAYRRSSSRELGEVLQCHSVPYTLLYAVKGRDKARTLLEKHLTMKERKNTLLHLKPNQNTM